MGEERHQEQDQGLCPEQLGEQECHLQTLAKEQIWERNISVLVLDMSRLK